MAGSSKVAVRTLLRGHGHLGKERARFQFDITIVQISGLHTGPHTIKWTRGGKVAYTKPFQLVKKSKEPLKIGQKISLLCTLYRSKSSTNPNSYDAKDSKLSLVSLKEGKKNEKTIGKIHFNIAQYAGVPSAEATVNFKLCRKVHADVTIACSSVQLSTMDSGSVGSGFSGMSASSGEPENMDEDEDEENDHEFADGMLLSPITPAPQNTFNTAKAIFESNDKGESSLIKDNNRKGQIASKNIENGKDNFCSREENMLLSDLEGKARLGGMVSSTRRKDKNTPIEAENTTLRREVLDTKSELEKSRRLHRMSEEVIKELRQALSQHELDMKATRAKHNEALRIKTVEMNTELANIERKAVENLSIQEEEIKKLRTKIDASEKAKQKLEEKLVSLQRDEVKTATRSNQELGNALLHEEINNAKRDREEADAKCSKETARRKVLEEKCECLDNEILRLHKQLEFQEENSTSAKKSLDELTSSYENLRQENDRLLSVMQASNGRPHSKDLISQQNVTLERLQKTLNAANEKIRELEEDRKASQNNANHSSSTLKILKKDLDGQQAEYAKLEAEFRAMKTKYNQACFDLEDADRKVADLESRVDAEEISSLNMLRKNNEDCQQDDPNSMQERVSKVLRRAVETKRELKSTKEELKKARRRERLKSIEIRRMKDIVDKITAEIEAYADQEDARIAKHEQQLEEARCETENAKSKYAKLAQEEIARQQEISRLETAVRTLEEKAELSHETNNSVLDACRSDLQQKKEDLESASGRISSLEKELLAKTEVEESLMTQIRQLEIETEVIKKQANHEVEMAQAARKEVEMSYGDANASLQVQREELENLKMVADTLRVELERETEKAKDEAKAVQVAAKENRQLREEAEEKENSYEQEVSKQNTIIEKLQTRLQDAASQIRNAAEEARSEADKAMVAVQERKELASKLEIAAQEAQARENQIESFKERIEQLNDAFASSSDKCVRSIERVNHRLQLKEEEIGELLKREQSLKKKLDDQDERLTGVHKELTVSLQRCVNLSSSNKKLNEEKEMLVSQLEASMENNERNDQSGKDIDNLQSQLEESRLSITELETDLAELRTQLCDSQNKLAAVEAASSADISRTAAELENVRLREDAYKQDIEKKEELIDDLTSKLTSAVGKNAADSAMAHAELEEAQRREEAYRNEIEELKAKLEQIDEDMMMLRSANALQTVEIESELTEALSREESYQLEHKRLKATIKKLEQKIDECTATISDLREQEQSLESSAICARCGGDMEQRTSSGARADKAMAEVLGIGDSLSSSNIRNTDVLEKITDARLLEMLVETKMQLALAEEEKLQLEHLIQRIRDGDEHVQEKLAKQASELEFKLTRAKDMVDSMQDKKSKKKKGSKASESAVLEREKNVMKGEQLQFFRRPQKKQSKANGRDQRKDRQKEQPPSDEWDLGDDSAGEAGSSSLGRSGGSTFSARSTDME